VCAERYVCVHTRKPKLTLESKRKAAAVPPSQCAPVEDEGGDNLNSECVDRRGNGHGHGHGHGKETPTPTDRASSNGWLPPGPGSIQVVIHHAWSA
jgi:hypothetical protein